MADKYYVQTAINKPHYEISSLVEKRDGNNIKINTVETYFSNFPPEEEDPEWDLAGYERFAADEIKLPLKDSNPSKEKLEHLAWYAFWWKLFTETEKFK